MEKGKRKLYIHRTKSLQKDLYKYKRQLKVWRKKRLVKLDNKWNIDLLTLKKTRRLQDEQED